MRTLATLKQHLSDVLYDHSNENSKTYKLSATFCIFMLGAVMFAIIGSAMRHFNEGEIFISKTFDTFIIAPIAAYQPLMGSALFYAALAVFSLFIGFACFYAMRVMMQREPKNDTFYPGCE